MEGFFPGLTTVRWGETNGEKQRISEKNGEKKRLLFIVVNFQIINI
jgi:hypothetical protein